MIEKSEVDLGLNRNPSQDQQPQSSVPNQSSKIDGNALKYDKQTSHFTDKNNALINSLQDQNLNKLQHLRVHLNEVNHQFSPLSHQNLNDDAQHSSTANVGAQKKEQDSSLLASFEQNRQFLQDAIQDRLPEHTYVSLFQGNNQFRRDLNPVNQQHLILEPGRESLYEQNAQLWLGDNSDVRKYRLPELEISQSYPYENKNGDRQFLNENNLFMDTNQQFKAKTKPYNGQPFSKNLNLDLIKQYKISPYENNFQNKQYSKDLYPQFDNTRQYPTESYLNKLQGKQYPRNINKKFEEAEETLEEPLDDIKHQIKDLTKFLSKNFSKRLSNLEASNKENLKKIDKQKLNFELHERDIEDIDRSVRLIGKRIEEQEKRIDLQANKIESQGLEIEFLDGMFRKYELQIKQQEKIIKSIARRSKELEYKE